MAKVIVTNLTGKRIGVPTPINRVLAPFQEAELNKISADDLEKARNITRLIDAGLITIERFDDDDVIDNTQEPGSLTWGTPLNSPADLPAVGLPGQTHQILDDGDGKTALYVWNPTTAAWEKQADPDSIGVALPGSSTERGLLVFANTTGSPLLDVGIRMYDASATNPTSPTPSDGDLYYNTSLSMWMFYDGSRSKWLSVEVVSLGYGRKLATAPGSFFRGKNDITFTSTLGYNMKHAGTVVSLDFSRDNALSTTLEVTADGSTLSGATLATGTALLGKDNTINSDFSADQILGVRNQSGGADTNNIQGLILVRWRV